MSKRVATSSVAADDLRVGSVYFALGYVDREMRVPVIETYVYRGCKLNDGDKYFLFEAASDYFTQGPGKGDTTAFRNHTGVKTLENIVNDLNNLLSNLSEDTDPHS
jgi:hypothetical protein